MIKENSSLIHLMLSFILFYTLIISDVYSSVYKLEKTLLFDQINVEDGLSQGTIFCIFQDSRGFLWFGTQYGLNRFDGYSYKIYLNNPSDSLSISDNFILSIAEDKQGNLWIGTENGLNKYDYKKDIFVRYFDDSTNMVIFSSVIVDKNGAVWAGTFTNGLYRLTVDEDEIKNITITNYRFGPNDSYSLSSDLVRCVYEDTKGRIWIGTENGLNLFVDNNMGIFKKIKNIYNENKTIESQIWVIHESNFGKLLVGSTAGLFSIHEDLNNSFYLTDFFAKSKDVLIPKAVISACHDNLGNLWIGTYAGGLYLWNENNYEITSIIGKNNNKALQTKSIFSILIDRSNVVWVGTKSGLFKWTSSNNYFDNNSNYSLSDKNSGGSNLILTFLQDKNDKIWIGTEVGIDIIDPLKKHYERFNLENYIHDEHNDFTVRSIYQDKGGVFWIGTTWRGLFQMVEDAGYPKKYSFNQYWHNHNSNPGLFDNSVLKIVEDKWGYLWLATKLGIKRFNKKDKIFYDLTFSPQSKINPPENLVFEIFQSPKNPDIIWIGTRSEGMFQVILGKNDGEITGLRHFISKPNNTNSLGSPFVRTILEDKKGRLWVGTISGGLNLLNTDSTTFTHFGVKDGLPSEAITGILEGDFGYLWISTISGLCRFDPELKESIIFSASDGLRNDEFNGGSYLKIESGELFFGGVNGFDIVHPELVKKNELPPPVVITEIQLYNQSILNRIQKCYDTDSEKGGNDYGEIELDYNENVISFEFSALDYVNPVNNQYAYMMEGVDTSWIYVNKRRYASYSKIPPGGYIFSVKASNNNNVWNEDGAFIKIIITPPFWQTWWFRILIIVVFVVLITIVYRKRINKIKKKKRSLEIEVKEKTEDANKLQAALTEVGRLKSQLEVENIYFKDEIKLKYNFSNIITVSNSFISVLKNIEKVAQTDSTVLISGETGTGKELIARAIHEISKRKSRPLIKVDCASLPSTLIESELFGHERGAYTGAVSKKIGRFEFANGGTIFLDEIGEISTDIQSKLLRVIQEGEINRIGDPKTINIDVRIIAATNRNLEKEVKAGNFREDLFYRLNVFPITIPTLRQRKEDIPLLIDHFVKKYSQKMGKQIDKIPQSVINDLIEYDWPGNVRELENIIERAVILCRGTKFELFDGFNTANIKKTFSNYTGILSLEEMEKQYILKILESTGWHVYGENGAAKMLGLKPTTLASKMKKLQISKLS
jgi:DNA-binding NtrC family response regulator/ligand-binding sensor domain-containing protein